MNSSDFPRDFRFGDCRGCDGLVADGTYQQLRSATVPDYGDKTKLVEKIILELEIAGELRSIWLGEAKASSVLLNNFRRELGKRARLGKSDFEPQERIRIIRSAGRRPSKKSSFMMFDWNTEFEHAAPPPTPVELLLGGGGEPTAPTVIDTATAATDDGELDFGEVPFHGDERDAEAA
jgi:hypothetical protein